jgi:hypothetical protein
MANAIHIAEYEKDYFFVLIMINASDDQIKQLIDSITGQLVGAKSIVFLYYTPQNGDEDKTIIKIGRPKLPQKLIRLGVYELEQTSEKIRNLNVNSEIGKNILETIQDTYWFKLHKYLPESKRVSLFEYDKGHYVTLTANSDLDTQLTDILKCLNDYKSVTIVNSSDSRTKGEMGTISDKILSKLDIELQTQVMVDEQTVENLPQNMVKFLLENTKRAKEDD